MIYYVKRWRMDRVLCALHAMMFCRLAGGRNINSTGAWLSRMLMLMRVSMMIRHELEEPVFFGSLQ
jgi:hypothetical protein